MINRSRKNGTIELLRFIFCIGIFFFHVEKYLFGEPSFDKGIDIALFPHGAIGVEFFFLVSGYLMAKSLYENQIRGKREFLVTETIAFMKKKYLSIFSYHIIALIGVFIIDCILKKWNFVQIVRRIIDMLPNVFLIQMSGISIYNPNHITWYLSVMLIAMFILYPIAYCYYDSFIKIIIPIVSILVIGSFAHSDKSLTGVMVWTYLGYKGTIRGIVEIGLGMLSFEIENFLKMQVISEKLKCLLRVVEWGCYVSVLIFSVMTFPKIYEIYALFALFVGVTITFSEITQISFLNNKICESLGRMSLPIYLCQLGAINIGVAYFGKNSYFSMKKVLFVGALTLVFSIICKLVAEKINTFIVQYRRKSINNIY